MFFKKKEFIPYGKQTITGEDIKEVIKTLKSDYITQGPKIIQFENELSKKVNSKYSISMNSATSALHLSCLALDLQKDDLVWTSTISFVASANCALYCGAKIDFIDINANTGLIDENLLEEKLEIAAKRNNLPKIIIPVHLAGTPCNMKKIFELSKIYGFKIIEDASHALGAKYKNNFIGSCKYSDITVFSFHPVKIITTCEGGVATTNNRKLYKKLKKLSSHGITKNKSEFKYKNDCLWYYEQNELGYNYRLNDVQASLGISQLKRLEKIIKDRNKLLDFYKKISNNTNFSFLEIPNDCLSSVHLAVIKFKVFNPKTHKNIFKKMRNEGIGVQVHYLPIHLQPYYRNKGFSKGDFPIAERYSKNSFSLPLYPGLKSKFQIKIINLIERFLK